MTYPTAVHAFRWQLGVNNDTAAVLIGSAMIRLNTSQLTDRDDVYRIDMDEMWLLDAATTANYNY